MNVKEFRDSVCDKLRDIIPDGAEVVQKDAPKNNGVVKYGIMIKGLDKEDDDTVLPVLYMGNYYNSYGANEDTMGTICDRILNDYIDAKKDAPLYTKDDILSFDNVKDKIIFSILNYELNQEKLKDLHYKDIGCGLVKIYKIVLNLENGVFITLSNENIDMLEHSAAEIEELAELNTPLILPQSIQSLGNMLGLTKGGDSPETYVVTNEECHLGAAVLFYDGVMRDLYQKIGDYYVLPSSIHEVLVVPKDGSLFYHLKQMVADVNGMDDCVPREDLLAYDVYAYDSVSGSLVIPDESEADLINANVDLLLN